MKRVSDMLCTGHATLRDRYQRRALFLDLSILLLSTWLVALTFLDPHIAGKLTPSHVDPSIWIGMVGVFTFALSLVQIKVDWKGVADAHNRSFDLYAEVKRQCVYILCSPGRVEKRDCEGVLAVYDIAGQVGAGIPEMQFLRLKKKHIAKIAVSKLLDANPGASIFLTRCKIWLQNKRKKDGGAT
jgi:hypothetical protein